MLLLSEIIAPKTENIGGRNAPGPAAHLVVVQLEEGLEVVDEVGVGADQRLDDGHARPGHLARPLRVRGPGPPVQPPLAETNSESLALLGNWGEEDI